MTVQRRTGLFILLTVLAGIGNFLYAENQKQASLSVLAQKVATLERSIFAGERLTGGIPPYAACWDPYQLNLLAYVNVEGFLGRNLELLNDQDYDTYGFLQHTADVGFHVNKEPSPAEHNRLEGMVIARSKGIFGNHGYFVRAYNDPVKVGIGRTETISHTCFEQQPVWLREAWFKYGRIHGGRVELMAGLFPYSIGSGLVLGNGHLVGKAIPGLYDERFVDQYRAGIKLTFTNCDATRYWSVYYGVLDAASVGLRDNAQFIRAQEPSDRVNPYRGPWAANTIVVSEWRFSQETPRCNAFVNINPYALYNYDGEQCVEVRADAESRLFIGGLAAQFKHQCFEINAECAFNAGYQSVHGLDRNQILAIGPKVQQTHLFQKLIATPATPACGAAGTQCDQLTPYTAALRRTYPEDLGANKAAGEEFFDQLCNAKEQFKNSYNRFRNCYRNKYQGFMAYVDGVYFFNRCEDGRMRCAVAAGVASGDEQPNDSVEKILANRFNSDTSIYRDCTKAYKGFVGVEQLYSGRAVRSVFLLEARKLNRPLSEKHPSVTYPEFTNMAFIGAGFGGDRRACERSFEWAINGLVYLQPQRTSKGFGYPLSTLFKLSACPEQAQASVVPLLAADASRCLGNLIGWEVNASINYDISSTVRAYVLGAVFVPGSYYDCSVGKVVPLAVQFDLSQADYTGIEDCRKYDLQLGSSPAFIFNAGFEVEFDLPIRVGKRERPC